MLDEHILVRPDIDTLADITDRPPSDYMTHHFGPISQMLTRPKRMGQRPILSIRYGDGGLGRFHAPEELTHNVEKRTLMDRVGLVTAINWLVKITDGQNTPIQPMDPRTRGMQIINLEAVNYGSRLWKTHPDDSDSEWEDNRESDDSDDDLKGEEEEEEGE